MSSIFPVLSRHCRSRIHEGDTSKTIASLNTSNQSRDKGPANKGNPVGML
jgi:hypothetical protein